QRFAVLQPLLELGRLAGKLIVGERPELGLEGAGVRRLLAQALEPAALPHPQNALELAVRIGRHRDSKGSGWNPRFRPRSRIEPDLEWQAEDLPEVVGEPVRVRCVGPVLALGRESLE